MCVCVCVCVFLFVCGGHKVLLARGVQYRHLPPHSFSYGMGILDEIHTNSSIKVEDNTPHCGRKKDPGGPAERDGKQSVSTPPPNACVLMATPLVGMTLQEGDELLENNGKSTERTGNANYITRTP